MSNYIVDGSDLTYEADRIRAKTGENTPIEFKAGKGFGDAIDAIVSKADIPVWQPGSY